MNNNAEVGLESGEIKKKEDFDNFYKMRADSNKQKYIELLNQRVLNIIPKPA